MSAPRATLRFAMAIAAEQVEYRGRWEDGEPGWRRYRTVKGVGKANQPQGERYPVLTFACPWCADRRMHTAQEHATLVRRVPGRYVREADRPFEPKRHPRTPPDPKGTRR